MPWASLLSAIVAFHGDQFSSPRCRGLVCNLLSWHFMVVNVSSSRCHRLVCNLLTWYFMVVNASSSRCRGLVCDLLSWQFMVNSFSSSHAVGLSSVCDFGISCSCSLTFQRVMIVKQLQRYKYPPISDNEES